MACDIANAESVGHCIEAAFVDAVDGGIGIEAPNVDGTVQGVDALVVGDTGDERHVVDASVGEVQCLDGVSGSDSAGQNPATCLTAFSRADGRNAVARDGAAVGECQVELAVRHGDKGVDDSQRVACPCEGTHGEVAGGVVDERESAEVGQ